MNNIGNNKILLIVLGALVVYLIWKNCACNKESFEPDRLSVEETEELMNKISSHFSAEHNLNQAEMDQLRIDLEEGRYSEEEIQRLRIKWNIKKRKAGAKLNVKDAKVNAKINIKKRHADLKKKKAQYNLNQKKEQ